jgi:hypothetical protein
MFQMPSHKKINCAVVNNLDNLKTSFTVLVVVFCRLYDEESIEVTSISLSSEATNIIAKTVFSKMVDALIRQ